MGRDGFQDWASSRRFESARIASNRLGKITLGRSQRSIFGMRVNKSNNRPHAFSAICTIPLIPLWRLADRQTSNKNNKCP